MDPLSTTFAALADPTRRAILARLARGDAPVSELAQPFAISAPAISRHLRVLADAGLVERRVHARWRICRLRGEELHLAHDWLTQYRQYWEGSLDRLVAYLEHPPGDPASTPSPPSPRARNGARKPRSTTSTPSTKRTKRSSR